MSFIKVEYASTEHGTEYRYEPEYPEDLETIPCFHCNATEDVDIETGLCKGECKPQFICKDTDCDSCSSPRSLSTCNGNFCQVYWTPEDGDEPF